MVGEEGEGAAGLDGEEDGQLGEAGRGGRDEVGVLAVVEDLGGDPGPAPGAVPGVVEVEVGEAGGGGQGRAAGGLCGILLAGKGFLVAPAAHEVVGVIEADEAGVGEAGVVGAFCAGAGRSAASTRSKIGVVAGRGVEGQLVDAAVGRDDEVGGEIAGGGLDDEERRAGAGSGGGRLDEPALAVAERGREDQLAGLQLDRAGPQGSAAEDGFAVAEGDERDGARPWSVISTVGAAPVPAVGGQGFRGRRKGRAR